MSEYQKTKWCRIRGACPCCGRRRYCTASEDGAVIKCMRKPSSKPVTHKDGSIAYIHENKSNGSRAVSLERHAEVKKLTTAQLVALLKQNATAVNPEKLVKFAESMKLSVRSLKAYGVGWDSNTGAWSFPMYDGSLDGKGRLKPCGIRLRINDKVKLSVLGSSNGLFVANDMLETATPIPDCIDVSSPEPLLLLLPEGPTDAAAARDMGFRAIGRPSNSGGVDAIQKILTAMPQQEIILVADRDEAKYLPDGTPFWPGIEGALSIASRIVDACKVLRYMMPPDGFKDLRAWLPTAKVGDLLIATAKAPIVDRIWIAAAEKRLIQKRLEERKAA